MSVEYKKDSLIMENDWLYEFQKYIKKFTLSIAMIGIIFFIIFILYL